MIDLPRLTIAAPSSGCGKSLVASGIMASFAKRFPVQGYKVGPDYIDPMYHSAATGRPSRNLDTWMLSQATVQRLFLQAAQDAGLAIIEGVMGLFDGYDADPFQGSTAQVARLLGSPVILVVDCARMSGSAAALVHGFDTFARDLSLAGVICNRVGSERHAGWLRTAIASTGVAVLGCIPRLPQLHVPERHLGLFTVAERPAAVREFLTQVVQVIETYIDMEALLALARSAPALTEAGHNAPPSAKSEARIAVAQDEAFCFYYEDNLDELRRCGAEIIPFSPLHEHDLPQGVCGIYVGGGYPELYAEPLSRNTAMLQQILERHRAGIPIYAECGGLMYLTQGILHAEGQHALVGALPGWCKMSERLKMGYCQAQTLKPGPLAQPGVRLRGHEFHYSHWENPDPQTAVFRVDPRGPQETHRLEGYAQGNLHASYIHLHFAQDASLAENFVRQCLSWQLANRKETKRPV
jgi:cobyrinic acid a,c-diamide synthase